MRSTSTSINQKYLAYLPSVFPRAPQADQRETPALKLSSQPYQGHHHSLFAKLSCWSIKKYVSIQYLNQGKKKYWSIRTFCFFNLPFTFLKFPISRHNLNIFHKKIDKFGRRCLCTKVHNTQITKSKWHSSYAKYTSPRSETDCASFWYSLGSATMSGSPNLIWRRYSFIRFPCMVNW